MMENEKEVEAAFEKHDRTLAKNRNGELHLRKVRSDGWSEANQATFLDHLAGTCNVDAAAKAAGHSAQSAKGLRLRDPEFRDSWDRALETGYAMLEAMLLKRAQRVAEQPFSDEAGAERRVGEQVFEDMTTRDAMELLDRHKKAVARIRIGKEVGGSGKTATAKETYKAIIERMCVLKMRLDDEHEDRESRK